MIGFKGKVWNKYHSIYKLEWIITSLIILAMLLIYTYVDTVSLTIWSTNIWDCLAKGDFLGYHVYTTQNLHGLAHIDSGGSIFNLLPWAIWNIPIWAVQYFGGIEITQSVLCMLWSKLFLIVATIVFLKYVYKICMYLWDDKMRAELVMLLCVSSCYFHMGVSYAGQNDILWIAMGTISVYYYLKKEWGKFLVFANLAIIVKPYFLITAIALILLREKRVFKIIANVCLTVAGYGIVSISHGIVARITHFTSANTDSKMMFRTYVENTIVTPYGIASILIIAIIVIYNVCYIYKVDDNSNTYDPIIYIISLINVGWCVLSYENFYRVIMVLPWLYILLLNRKSLLELNLCINSLLSGAWLLVCINTGGAMFDSYRGMKPSILQVVENKSPELFEKGSLYLLQMDVFERIGGYETFLKILYGIWIGLVIGVLTVNHPSIADYYEKEHEVQETKWFVRLLLWFHIIMIVPFVCLACLRTTGVL